MSDTDLRKQLNEEWKDIVKNDVHGPAPFYDPDDYGDASYVRVTRDEALAGRPCRMYADGVYDVFHSGHARQLMQAKNTFPNVTLIAGCHSDKVTHANKGKTVCTDEERYEAVRHCRYVDMLIPDAPLLTYTDEFFNKYRIDFIAHDDVPYNMGGAEDTYAYPKRLGIFCATQRTEGISTSDIVTRIVKNHDSYISRNLSRGYNRRELNVGPIHATWLKTKQLLGKWKKQQVNHVRQFLDSYAPEILNKGLDVISPRGRSITRKDEAEKEPSELAWKK